MKFFPKSLSLTFGLLILTIGANFSHVHATNEFVTPTSVGCFEHGECFIIASAPLVGASSCVTDRNQIRFLSTQPGADAMYKTALAAFLSGKRLIVNPYTQSCVSGFMKPWYLYVTN